MKLQQLSEVDMNRRNFLKGTGAILTKLLIGGGMPAELAQQFSKSKTISVMSSYFSYDNNRAEDVVGFIKNATNLAHLCGTNTVEIYDDGAGDSLTYGTTIDQNKLIELLKNNKYQVLNDELEIKLPGNEALCSITLDEVEGGTPVSINQIDLLKSWWHNYGNYSVQPIDDAFGNILKKAGINPSKTIEDFTRENIADIWLESSPEERMKYGDLKKYGFSKQEIAELQRAAKEAEIKEIEPVKKQIDKDQDIQSWENEGGYATECRTLSDKLKMLFR